jgi:hypothetical protein
VTTSPRPVAIIVFVSAALMFGYNVQGFILGKRDPYQYSGAYAQPAIIHAGDILRTVYLFDHIRVCSTKLARFVENTDTKEIVYRDEIIGGAAPLGNNQAPILKIQTDKDWLPGNYVLRLAVNAQCADDIHQYYAPEITFKVIAQDG